MLGGNLKANRQAPRSAIASATCSAVERSDSSSHPSVIEPCADAWDDQLFFMASNGFRAIAHDRRGHGRSSQPWEGNDMDHYADDLAELIDSLDLHDAVLVGHSTGGGEVVRYIGRHGASRVSQAVLVGAVPPLMLETADNPGGTPLEVFDG